MLYQSTRSTVTASPAEAVLRGIAPDGGLYVMPAGTDFSFDWQNCLRQDSFGMATRILSRLLPDFPDMEVLVRRAYEGKFETDRLTPVVPVGEGFVLELFRGPTSAFKDVALSMLPQLISAAKTLCGVTDEIVILTATSGDTGKAALEGFHDTEGTRIFVFYPAEGVSPVQKAQMVTQVGSNVTVCAVDGNFDDCQRGVKETFAAYAANDLHGVRLSSANSINIGRLVPQIVYYFIAYSELCKSGSVVCGDPVDFVVPTGNFGDILAGYFAKLLGLPVRKLVCASNANNVLTDFLRTGVYDRRRPFLRTASPSMDILVSSNLERLLFLASGGDTETVRACMERLGRDGVYRIPDALLAAIRRDFTAYCCDEAQTADTIGKVWQKHRYLCDPHTAVAFYAAEAYKRETHTGAPVVILSTASPYKFPSPVLRAIGGTPEGDEFRQMEQLRELTGLPVPAGLSGLQSRPVLHTDRIPRSEVTAYVAGKLVKKEAEA